VKQQHPSSQGKTGILVNYKSTTWQPKGLVAHQASAFEQVNLSTSRNGNSTTTLASARVLNASVVSEHRVNHKHTALTNDTYAPTRTICYIAADGGVPNGHCGKAIK
jgi:hypothetical protein